MQNHKDRLGNVHTTLDDLDTLTLANICRVAGERFKDHAKEFRKLIDYKPKPYQPGDTEVDGTPHGEGAKRLAEQFDRQAAEALEFATLFEDANHSEVVTEPGEEDEEAA